MQCSLTGHREYVLIDTLVEDLVWIREWDHTFYAKLTKISNSLLYVVLWCNKHPTPFFDHGSSQKMWDPALDRKIKKPPFK